MKPPPLRPLLPPPALRRRSLGYSSSTFAPASAPYNVSTFSSPLNFRSYSPHPTSTPVFRRPKHTSKVHQDRAYAIQTSTPLTLQVFNAATKHEQRERAALNVEASRRVDYLRDEVATRLCERILVQSHRHPLLLLCRSRFNTHPIPRLRSWKTRILNAISHTSSTSAPTHVM